MNEINIHKNVSSCIHCNSNELSRSGQTSLGYEKYLCEDCGKKSNERTGTPFNRLEYPTDVALLVVRWYLSYKLSLRDISEMFLERGYEFSHETVRNWVTRFTPLITEELRRRRKGKAGPSWYVDETYIKVKGSWVYLYRAIDRDGNLVDTMLRKRRNMKSAKRFFNCAKEVTGTKPDRVTTDHHGSYPRAIKETLGKNVLHRTNQYLNNRTEQSHRHLKQRYYPMLGFGNFKSAAIICRGIEELKNFFKPRHSYQLSAAEKRRIRASKIHSLNKMATSF